jgi:hypothetical protein
VKALFSLYVREIHTIILISPILLFAVFAVMCIPLFMDISQNRGIVSFITLLSNIAFYIPPLFLILSFQRDIRSHFSALASFRVSGARIMLAKYLAALTLGVIFSAAASIWPYMESHRAQGLFQLAQARTGFGLLVFRYFLNVLFFSGLVCLAEGLQFMFKRFRELIWIAAFLVGTAILFLPGKAMYAALFAGFTFQDSYILISGIVFFIIGLVFYRRYGGTEKGTE